MIADTVQSRFDYAELDSETRIVVQQRTEEIRVLVRRSAQDIIDIGTKLTEVKARLGHGNFGPWLAAEFGWGVTTAWKFMIVSAKFSQNENLAHFAPSALYLLASPSTPDEARTEALSMAKDGKAITHAIAQEIIWEYKAPTHDLPENGNGNGSGVEEDDFDIDDPLFEDWLDEAEEDNKDLALRKGMNEDDLFEYSLEVVNNRANIERKQAKVTSYITLDAWKAGARQNGDVGKSQLNETNDNIEWAAWSWNPVTGCLHDCNYCYARDIANRFYEQKFAPSFLPERLSAPSNTKIAKPRWDGDDGYKNVFTCSMADLFGKWVPRDWIKSVLKVVEDNPQWTFLFLTKFPVRMAEFNYPANVWLGTTVDKQYAVERAESAFKKIKASGFNGICWLSCEPMLERLQFTNLKMFDWVVMGGASKSTQTPEMRPPFDDIVSLYQQARKSGCRIYMKTNLGIEQRIREYPQ